MNKVNLENTLIAEIIQLFAVMAEADGKVSDQEKIFVKRYFNSLYPESFAEVLYTEFERAIQSELSASTVLSSIQRRLNLEDKIFLFVKLIELMATDGIDETERKLLDNIAQEFKLREGQTHALIRLITESERNLNDRKNGFSFAVINFSDLPGKSEVWVPFEKLDVSIINIGKSLLILQRDGKNKILLNNKQIIKNFTTRIPNNCSILINNRFEIVYQDLRYYFKNLNSPKTHFYLSKTNEDIEICTTCNDSDMILCERDQTKIYLTPEKDGKLKINGNEFREKTLVNFNDTIFWGSFKINLRTAVFQSVFLVGEQTRLTKANIRGFTIGNNLESTIHIEDAHEKLWNCQVELNDRTYFLDVNTCPYDVFINDKKVTKRSVIHIEDTIRIYNAMISYNSEKRVFEKNESGIRTFSAKEINYKFNDRTTGIDDVSFAAKRGEMVGIMGTSGSGKSTLLNVLNGLYKPQKGIVLADHYNVHQNLDLLSSYMSYVPQDDLLFEHLTVYENLYYNAKLRFPSTERNLGLLVDKVLQNIGMYDKKDLIVGSPTNKILSGGERKRVNIGLELLANSDIMLLDEPTSGLSSKDSERIIKLLQNLTFQGKIIHVVIHQPSLRLYECFNKIILLDKGGKLAYFGSPFAALKYFSKYTDNDQVNRESSLIDPDYLLDTLEQHISDLDGTPLPIRKYPPSFWQEEFRKHFKVLAKTEVSQNKKDTFLPPHRRSFKKKFSIARTLLERNFINKLRDRSNLVISFFLPPLLGLFVGLILRYSPGENYTFYENKHIGTFLFLAVLIAIFLGITNSVEEIIRDQHILLREKMLKISNFSYLNSKILTLIPFAIAQNLLFVVVGYFILEGKEFYLDFTLILTVVSLCGIAIGLFISSIPGLTSKAAVNIIPIILIPQIIFGGALIQYQEMNKQLVFNANSPIPELCQVMPSRWGFEALITHFGYNNRYRDVEYYEAAIEEINYKISASAPEKEVADLVEERKKLRQEMNAFKDKFHDTHGNLDISQAIKIDGNREFKDFKKGKTIIYPMFIGSKNLPLLEIEVKTPIYNGIVMLLMAMLIISLTWVIMTIRFR